MTASSVRQNQEVVSFVKIIDEKDTLCYDYKVKIKYPVIKFLVGLMPVKRNVVRSHAVIPAVMGMKEAIYVTEEFIPWEGALSKVNLSQNTKLE